MRGPLRDWGRQEWMEAEGVGGVQGAGRQPEDWGDCLKPRLTVPPKPRLPGPHKGSLPGECPPLYHH